MPIKYRPLRLWSKIKWEIITCKKLIKWKKNEWFHKNFKIKIKKNCKKVAIWERNNLMGWLIK